MTYGTVAQWYRFSQDVNMGEYVRNHYAGNLWYNYLLDFTTASKLPATQGLHGMDVSVLMGANLAKEVAGGAFCETTIGYNIEVRERKHFTLINSFTLIKLCDSSEPVCPLQANMLYQLLTC